ncbi:MAG: DAK2 domain-containing protein, partial [Actinobacteria bacterium]
MSLTMDAVMAELGRVDPGAGIDEVCKAVTHGSLMGARGNSGVILSQILRGICDGLLAADGLGPASISSALDHASTVAYQAVRKPVEGTMLTVVKDGAAAAAAGAAAGLPMPTLLDAIVDAAYESVRRGPDLLPVLKENGVVDAGGFGVAILAEGFVSALEGAALRRAEEIVAA